MVLVSLFQDRERVIFSLDLIDSVLVLLSKLLVAVTLDSNRGGLQLWVMCSLGRFIDHDHFLEIRIPNRSLAFVHGLVLLFNGLLVAQRRVYFLPDHGFHGVGHLIS